MARTTLLLPPLATTALSVPAVVLSHRSWRSPTASCAAFTTADLDGSAAVDPTTALEPATGCRR